MQKGGGGSMEPPLRKPLSPTGISYNFYTIIHTKYNHIAAIKVLFQSSGQITDFISTLSKNLKNHFPKWIFQWHSAQNRISEININIDEIKLENVYSDVILGAKDFVPAPHKCHVCFFNYSVSSLRFNTKTFESTTEIWKKIYVSKIECYENVLIFLW